MQFNPNSGNSSPTDLIPSGLLCWAMLTLREMKHSGETSGLYADIELVVNDGQPFARRKVWDKIADPDDDRNSEKWRNMGMVSLTRMMEAAGMVDPADPASYERVNGMSTQQILMALDGKYVAIKVGIEKGKDGHQDKNKVSDYLTPNPQSSGNKGYVKLGQGDYGVTANPAQGPRSGFAQGGGGGRPVAAQPSGFQRAPQPQGQSDRPLDAQNSTMKSPSDQGGGGGFNPNRAPGFLKAQ